MWAEFVWLRVTTVRDRLPGSRCWLVIRRSLDGDSEQTLKYYLSNAPADCSPEELVRLTGCRWPVETAFEEAKSEVGMAHYEIRGWLGWHHHMVQTFMAHLFLVHLQHLLQKKPGDHPQSSSTTHRPCHCRRVWRWPRRLGLHSVLAEAQSSGLCVTSQTHATPIAG